MFPTTLPGETKLQKILLLTVVILFNYRRIINKLTVFVQNSRNNYFKNISLLLCKFCKSKGVQTTTNGARNFITDISQNHSKCLPVG